MIIAVYLYTCMFVYTHAHLKLYTYTYVLGETSNLWCSCVRCCSSWLCSFSGLAMTWDVCFECNGSYFAQCVCRVLGTICNSCAYAYVYTNKHTSYIREGSETVL